MSDRSQSSPERACTGDPDSVQINDHADHATNDFKSSETQSPVTQLSEQAARDTRSFKLRTHTQTHKHSDLIEAVNRLERDTPEFSARQTTWPWQRRALMIGALTLALVILLSPATTMTVLFAVLAVPFLCVAAMRLHAIWHLFTNYGTKPKRLHSTTASVGEHANANMHMGESVRKLPDEELPTYAVLVPLFKEAHVVPGLLKALAQIDYPKDRIEISIITESVDLDTRAALERATLEDHMRVVVVPDGTPRTKPRALNYALCSASGEVVVVFDAEDVPEPDQLRRAAALLRAQPGKTGCIQACLNVYNARESWLTRQFTIEYTGLFDAMLPALERLAVPVPLGGTSNHFPRQVLESVGAWDPYNVTEDADLGIRLARLGWGVSVLQSTTWEEAPKTFNVWFGQRTRWMKGWMQTYLVHMREPSRLLHELGLKGFLGFQILMVTMIASPFVHPLFYIALTVELVSNATSVSGNPAQHASAISWLFWVGLINLVIGYASAIALGAISVAKRGWQHLVLDCLMMPFYWLLISLAAYCALFELVTAPHYWEKTDHAKIRDWAIPKADEKV